MEGKAKEALTRFQASKSDLDIMVNNNKMLLNSLTIEWLDSVNLFIEVYTTWESYNKVKQFSFKIVDENDKVLCDKWLSPYFNTRQEATEAAIKKAVEIFNERN